MDTTTKTVIAPDLLEALKQHLPSYATQSAFARELGVSSTQLSRALAGGEFKYNIADFEAKIRTYLATVTQVRKSNDTLLTEGFLVTEMAEFLTTVHHTRDIGVAWSDAGFGKTKGIAAYQLTDPLCIVVTARKSLCGWRAIRDAILSQMTNKRRIGGESWDQFIQRIFSGSGRLLIIDNAHLLTESARQWLAYDWHEETGCPLALVGNPSIKDQWSRNDQHQSRVGLAYQVSPQTSATETARTMLALYLPEGQGDQTTLKLATKVLKGKGACRSLRKHATLAHELLEMQAQDTPAEAFKAAHQMLLKSADFQLEAA